MSRRFLLVGIAVIIRPGTIVQLTAATLLSMIYLILQHEIGPYASPADNFIALASSFSLGAALSNTNVSATIAHGLVRLSSSIGPVSFLGVIFLTSSLPSCVVSNSATVVLLYSVSEH